MRHAVHRVTDFEQTGKHALRVVFADGLRRDIDFSPVLHGAIYGPLTAPEVFARVELDPEVGTLVWPNGADFDPETLHDWPDVVAELSERVRSWAGEAVTP